MSGDESGHDDQRNRGGQHNQHNDRPQQPQERQPQGTQPQQGRGQQPQEIRRDGTAANLGRGRGQPVQQGAAVDPSKSKIVGVVYAIYAALTLLIGLAIAALGGAVGNVEQSFGGTGALGGAIIIFGIVFILIGGLQAAVSWGLFKIKSWSWYAGFVLAILYALFGINGLLNNGGVVTIITLGLSIFSIYALWDEQAAYGVSIG